MLLAERSAFARDTQPPPPIQLTLDPVAATVPALKYQLLPEVRNQNPGNAAQLYLRNEPGVVRVHVERSEGVSTHG